MSRDKELHKEFKKRVVDYYKKLDAIYEFGVKKHTSMWCMAAAGNKFLIKPKTVESYIYS